MTTKHTSGPLQYAFEGGTVAFILESDGTAVAKLSVTENTTAHRALAENARLFSAAPDLLEALKWMVLRTEEGGYPDGKCLEEARVAIAKATGKQP